MYVIMRDQTSNPRGQVALTEDKNSSICGINNIFGERNPKSFGDGKIPVIALNRCFVKHVTTKNKHKS